LNAKAFSFTPTNVAAPANVAPAPVAKPEPPKKEPIVIKLEAIAREDDKENLVSAFK